MGHRIWFRSFIYRWKHGENAIIFWADMSSSVQSDNKDILILGEGPTQRLDDTTFTAETIYPIILHNQLKDLQ